MENNQQEILSEIKTLMSSVRAQLEQLDAKMAQLQQMYEPQEYDVEPIEMDFDVLPAVAVDDLPFFEDEQPAVVAAEPEIVEVVVPVEEPVEVPVEQPVAVPVEEPVSVPVEEPVGMFAEAVAEEPVAVPVAVIDVMATKHAWRNDMPGSPVRDVRAAIALVDRALFINSLFGENAMSFMETLNRINQAQSLDEVVEYLSHTYPEWDFDSDVVYRFMMAVRRKIS